MKRFLSLVLVTIMVLSTLALTSCDPIGSVKGFFNKIAGKESDELRTTVTLEEWIAAGNNTNFTFVMKESGIEIEALFSDNGARVRFLADEEIKQSLLIDFKNNCLVMESADAWLGYEDFYEISPEEYVLGNVLRGDEDSFGDLFAKVSYDEDEKCYYTESYGTITKYYFENGKMISAISLPEDPDDDYFGGAEIKNIGTTVVEVPEYTIINDGKVDPSKADPSVRTTITNEDLLNFFGNPNFTISLGDLSGLAIIGGVMPQISLKVAENGLELSVTEEGETENQYLAIVDGTVYSIERWGDEYLATSVGTIEEIFEELGSVEDISIVDYLVYDEAGRYYTLDIEGLKFYFFFEEGQLVKAVYIMDAYDLGSFEITISVSDIGTTEVEIPEYTIDDDPGFIEIRYNVTEEEWNANMSMLNYTAEQEARVEQLQGDTVAFMNVETSVKSNEKGFLRDDYTQTSVGYEATTSKIFAYADGNIYELTYDEASGVYNGVISEEFYTTDEQTIGVVLSLYMSDYNEYIFDSSIGAYVYSYEEGGYIYEDRVFFENGVIVKYVYSATPLEAYPDWMRVSFTVLFSDLGTTEVEIPEFVK